MPSIQSQLEQAFRAAIRAAFGFDADPIITVSQNEDFGDYQANAAMGLAREIGQRTGQKANPRQVAEQIKAKLELGEMASEVSIAGPGFINVRLAVEWTAQRLANIRKDGRLGIEPVGRPQRVVIDYSGPNVAKQMHVGHLRPTNIGDALSRILEFDGHTVIRQNHIGDWGTQFGMMLAYLKESGGAHDAHISDLEEFYRSAKKRFDEEAHFAEAARQMVVRLQAGGAEELSLWRRIIDESRSHFEALYRRMNVRLTMADERGESFYNPMLGEVVKELRDKGIVVESQGATVVWVEGFEAPLIVQKSDGGYGYATTDLTALRYRTRELGAQWCIYVTDARQTQHFKQFFAAARRADWVAGVRLDHVTFGTILGPNGKPFKTKSGENVKLKDLLDEAEQRAFALVSEKDPDLPETARRDIARAVGIGAIKYFDLARDWIGDYVFSWEQMLSFDGNTAPYLQNAYVRIRSIFRKGEQPSADAVIHLQSPHELALAKHLLRLGEILDLVSRELKPHHLCKWLYELATRFHAFYENCPVIQSTEPTRSSRLALCEVTGRGLALGLELLGIEHPEQM